MRIRTTVDLDPQVIFEKTFSTNYRRTNVTTEIGRRPTHSLAVLSRQKKYTLVEGHVSPRISGYRALVLKFVFFEFDLKRRGGWRYAPAASPLLLL